MLEYTVTTVRMVRSCLIEARKQRMWSQQELADLLGTTQNTVSRWELGRAVPSPYFLKKMCALFGTSPQALGLLDDPRDEVQHTNPTPLLASSYASLPSVDQHQPLCHAPYGRHLHVAKDNVPLNQLGRRLSGEKCGASTGTSQTVLTFFRAVKGCRETSQAQITVVYVSRTREQDGPAWTFWVTAASEEVIISRFVKLAELLPSVPLQDEEEEQDRRTFGEAITYWQGHCPQCWVLLSEDADENCSFQGNGNLFLLSSVSDVGSPVASFEAGNMGLIEGIQLFLQEVERTASLSRSVSHAR